MAFENMEPEPNMEEAGPPPEESNNRTFLIVAAALGAIALLALICMVVYAATQVRPRLDARNTAVAMAKTQSAIIDQGLAATKTAQSWTATPTVKVATNTPPPPKATNTPVVAIAVTNTPTSIVNVDAMKTATWSAVQTQAASLKQTPTATGLPQGGFADDVSGLGLPILLGIAALAVVVIFMARRLRSA